MTDSVTDPLSARGREILHANGPHAYESVVAGSTLPETYKLLSGLVPADLFALPIVSQASAATCLAALWLWHDELEIAHRTFQQSPAALNASAQSSPPKTGLHVLSAGSPESDQPQSRQRLKVEEDSLSVWHAIMHRREGDFSNSKYWYHRAGRHPLFDAIGANVAAITNPLPADKSLLRMLRDGWNPDALVDLAQELNQRPDPAKLPVFVAIQQTEWRMLFDHCARQAVAK